MTGFPLVAWAVDRRMGGLLLSLAPDRPDFALRRRLGWAAPAGAAFASIIAAVGAALGDRPSAFAALVLGAALATVALLLRGLTSFVLVRLSAAAAEADVLRAELDAMRQTNDAFRDLAYHDQLTGLPNRGLLYDRLGLAVAQSHREASHLALLFLDLDDFKAVNDSLGHGFGDRVIVDLAQRIRGCVRAGDTVARLGGDEFVVLLDPVAGAEDAARVAAKVRDAVRVPSRLDGREVFITASIGISVYPADGTSPEALVKNADAAMYRDKQRESALGPGADPDGALATGIGFTDAAVTYPDHPRRRAGIRNERWGFQSPKRSTVSLTTPKT